MYMPRKKFELMKTRTGNYPIGFRYGGSEWQHNLSKLIEWAKASGLGVIDFGADGEQSAQKAVESGILVGSVDLLDWKNMICLDKDIRADAIARNRAYIEACAVSGPINHFLVMLPQDPSLSRLKNFGFMVESFNHLAPVLEANQARLVIEGWPGPGALCCTPEGYRAFFKECPSLAMGINYDASHLIRMGIDYLRFLQEFGRRVYHVHGKDTEIFTENLYEYGREQEATFAEPTRHGSYSWRYCIPGHGVNQWQQILRLLVMNSYKGCISVELEDSNFFGNTEAEQMGILAGARFLASC